MAICLSSWACTSSCDRMLQRQRLLISTRGRSSESRTGENPTYGLTRGLEETWCTRASTQMLNGHWASPVGQFTKRHTCTI